MLCQKEEWSPLLLHNFLARKKSSTKIKIIIMIKAHLRIILREVVLLSGRTVPVVLRIRHRQPIGLAVEVVDLARGHGVGQ